MLPSAGAPRSRPVAPGDPPEAAGREDGPVVKVEPLTEEISSPDARRPGPAAPAGGPTAARMMLGTQLRRLREAAGITRHAAGDAIRASHAKISRLELGRVGVKERDLRDLLTLYGVDDPRERAALEGMVAPANVRGWWQQDSDLLPSWFEMYLRFEQEARSIRCFQVQFVPGLLQTDAYARAVIRLGHNNASRNEIDRRTKLRMARKQLLVGEGAPRLWAVLDEGVLRRLIGGREVLREQILSLLAACDEPNIRLQVMPFASGGHAAAGGAFSILRFPHTELSDVVYIEHLTSALYLDKQDDVDHYAAAIGRLFIEAEPPDRTPEILQGILDDLDHKDLD
jgi:transcriptional regulator with XRE-family HTH domain